MSEKKQFHTGDLVSVSLSLLMGPNLMDGVYGLIDYVTGWPHMTHQLIRDNEPVGDWVRTQHPWLGELPPLVMDGDAPKEAREDTARAWLDEVVALHGEFHEVEAMPEGTIPPREPISELIDIVGPDKPIIVLDAGGGEAPK